MKSKKDIMIYLDLCLESRKKMLENPERFKTEPQLAHSFSLLNETIATIDWVLD